MPLCFVKLDCVKISRLNFLHPHHASPTKSIQDTTVTLQNHALRHICCLFHPYSVGPVVSTVNFLIANIALS